MQPVSSAIASADIKPFVTMANSSNSLSIVLTSAPTTLNSITKDGVVPHPTPATSILLPVGAGTASNKGPVQTLQPLAIKRTISTTSGSQVVTKVIFANPSASQMLPSSSSAGSNLANAKPQQPQSILLQSPTKTLMIPKNFVNLLNSQQVLKVPPGTPTKQGMYVLSPVKSQQQKIGLSASVMKSPRRIAPATNTTITKFMAPKLSVSVTQGASGGVTLQKPLAVLQSPTKVMLKPVLASQGIMKTPLANSASVNLAATTPVCSVVSDSVTSTLASSSTVSLTQLPDNKFHYVRLVSAPNSANPTSITIKQESGVAPVTSSQTILTALPTTTSSAAVPMVNSQIRFSVPIGAALKKQILHTKLGQKILIPAPNLTQLAPHKSSSQVNQMGSGSLIPLEPNSQNYVVVPSNFMTQIQQSSVQSNVQETRVVIPNVQDSLPTTVSKPITTTTTANTASLTSCLTSSYKPIAAATASSLSGHTYSLARDMSPQPLKVINGPRKPCNCTKSQCLKLYCDCFASGEFCNNCNCNNCSNNLHHEEERQKAIKACLDRNPMAFHPKIGKGREGGIERRHTKGCNCKRSGCLKNYCECFEAKILCTKICKCVSCKNSEESTEKKALMHLAVAAEVRVQQQAAAETNLSSQIFDLTSSKPQMRSRPGGKLPIFFVIDTVIEATVLCLLSQANEAEMNMKSEEETEKMLLEEFGRCLRNVISYSNQADASDSDCELS